jgi:hypothetical protein
MLEVSSDSETDWRHDSDTTDSESEAPVTTTVSDDEEEEARDAQTQADHELALRFKAADDLARGPKPVATTMSDDEIEVGEWMTMGETLEELGFTFGGGRMSDNDAKNKPARTSTILPGPVPLPPARAAATTATIDSPDGVHAHPACQTPDPRSPRVPQVSHAHAGPGERHACEEGSGT